MVGAIEMGENRMTQRLEIEPTRPVEIGTQRAEDEIAAMKLHLGLDPVAELRHDVERPIES
jgi:hypothetical protein